MQRQWAKRRLLLTRWIHADLGQDNNMNLGRHLPIWVIFSVLTAFAVPAFSDGSGERPVPPTRDPHSPRYVTATELPDGAVPPSNADGNFIVGPTHGIAPELAAQPATPNGTVIEFNMESADSNIYQGIARAPGTLGTPDPDDPAKLTVTTSHPAPYTRKVSVYVPKQYLAGSVAPFIVGTDGPDH